MSSVNSLFEKPLTTTPIQTKIDRGWLVNSIKAENQSSITVCKIGGWLLWKLGLAIRVKIAADESAPFVYVPWHVAKQYVQQKVGNFDKVPLGKPIEHDPEHVYKLSYAFINLLIKNTQTPTHEIQKINKKPLQKTDLPKIGLENPKGHYRCYINSVVQALRYCPLFVESCSNKQFSQILSEFDNQTVEKKMADLRKTLGFKEGQSGEAQIVLSQLTHQPMHILMSWDELKDIKDPSDIVPIQMFAKEDVKEEKEIGGVNYKLRSVILFKDQHYTTVVRNENGSWLHYDDLKVAGSSLEFIKSRADPGTIFLYEKVLK